MAFPTGWGRKCAVVISSTYVSGTSHTDFPVLVNEDMLPSEMFDADGSYPALNGGGDIRFSSDSAGTTQLACEVVSFVTDNDPANGSAEIWVKVPTLSGSTDTTIYVWYNKTGESQPAVTDTYGRNAVWADYIAVFHGNNAVDSAGNANDLTFQAGASANRSGKIGGAIDCVGGGSALSAGAYSSNNTIALTTSGTAYYSCFVYKDAHSRNTANAFAETLGTLYDQSANDGFAVYIDSESDNPNPGEIFLGVFGGNNEAHNQGISLATGAWYHVVGVFDQSDDQIRGYVNGALDFSSAQTNNSVASGSDVTLYIGTDINNNGGDYAIDESRWRIGSDITNEADWIATEYNNQNSPSSFATAGTPESVGGGAITGTGSVASQFSAIAGTAEREITGTSALESQSSTIAGTGAIGGAITGTASLGAQSSIIEGTGTRVITSAAELVSQASVIAGVAERVITGTSGIEAQSSSIAGTGTVTEAGVVSGTGALDSQSSTISGTGILARTGTGTIAAGVASIDATGIITRVGTGALASQASSISGTGTVSTPQTITGTGSLVCGVSSISGNQQAPIWTAIARVETVWTEI